MTWPSAGHAHDPIGAPATVFRFAGLLLPVAEPLPGLIGDGTGLAAAVAVLAVVRPVFAFDLAVPVAAGRASLAGALPASLGPGGNTRSSCPGRMVYGG